MRTGSFSQSKIIEKLNAYFVPFYSVNEDHEASGSAPEPEKKEVDRIRREALSKQMSSGSVHVYIISPAGKVLGTLHVADAAQPQKLIALMERVVQEQKTQAGKPVVKPTPQSFAPKCATGGIVLHLTSRPFGNGGSWEGISENWITLDAERIQSLLPENPATLIQGWSPDSKAFSSILRHFYPVTENNDTSKNKIEAQSVKATLLSQKGQTALVRLEGSLRMAHWFYHKPDDKVVEASFRGYMEFDTARKTIKRLRIATQEAKYGGGTFGVAVRMEP